MAINCAMRVMAFNLTEIHVELVFVDTHKTAKQPIQNVFLRIKSEIATIYFYFRLFLFSSV